MSSCRIWLKYGRVITLNNINIKLNVCLLQPFAYHTTDIFPKN